MDAPILLLGGVILLFLLITAARRPRDAGDWTIDDRAGSRVDWAKHASPREFEAYHHTAELLREAEGERLRRAAGSSGDQRSTGEGVVGSAGAPSEPRMAPPADERLSEALRLGWLTRVERGAAVGGGGEERACRYDGRDDAPSLAADPGLEHGRRGPARRLKAVGEQAHGGRPREERGAQGGDDGLCA